MTTVSDLEERIKRVEERNSRVENDKAWETSWTRRLLLFVFTYLAIGIYMWAIGIPKPWINAVVPATGFLLSTLTLPLFKNLWLKYKKGELESVEETAEILAIPGVKKSITVGLKQAKKGEGIPLAKL